MSFYSMVDIGHGYCTQRRDLVTLPTTSHSHCECFLLVQGRSISQAERTRSCTAFIHSSNPCYRVGFSYPCSGLSQFVWGTLVIIKKRMNALLSI